MNSKSYFDFVSAYEQESLIYALAEELTLNSLYDLF